MTNRFRFDPASTQARAEAIRRGENSPPIPSPSRLSQESRESQLTPVLAAVLADLGSSADAKDTFEERAAILEYDAGLPRAEAERRARAELALR